MPRFYVCFRWVLLFSLGLVSVASVAGKRAIQLTADDTTSYNPIPRFLAAGAEDVKIGFILGSDISYEVPMEILLQAFTAEYADGTVVDRVMVNADPAAPRTKPVFYLIGMGKREGQFRAMALQLRVAEDKSFWLSPSADRNFAEGFKCRFCFFEFVKGQVSSAACAEKGEKIAPDRRCDFRTEKGNQLLHRPIAQAQTR